MPSPSSSPQPGCETGHHRPCYRHRDVAGETIQRSACRCCGASIMKMAIGRRWIVSGMLG